MFADVRQCPLLGPEGAFSPGRPMTTFDILSRGGSAAVFGREPPSDCAAPVSALPRCASGSRRAAFHPVRPFASVIITGGAGRRFEAAQPHISMIRVCPPPRTSHRTVGSGGKSAAASGRARRLFRRTARTSPSFQCCHRRTGPRCGGVRPRIADISRCSAWPPPSPIPRIHIGPMTAGRCRPAGILRPRVATATWQRRVV
jgi:hypothetical protein